MPISTRVSADLVATIAYAFSGALFDAVERGARLTVIASS